MSCHLLIVSHDELGVIFDGLADPLHPAVAVDLSSTAKGLRTPLTVALQTLKQQHETVVALCDKMETTCEEVRHADTLRWDRRGAASLLYGYRPERTLSAHEMGTLGQMLRTNGLPWLQSLWLLANAIGDAGLRSLCQGLECGGAPSLSDLNLGGNQITPAGVASLAGPIGKGALRRLEKLNLGFNSLGKQGMAMLAPLRQLPLLHTLNLKGNEIGDEGVSALLAELGKDDFKKLRELRLDDNELTSETCDTLICVVDSGALPKIKGSWKILTVDDNPAISVGEQLMLHNRILDRGRIPLSTERVVKSTNIGGAY